MATGHPQLISRIRDQILTAPNRAISFHDYMELCLYDKDYGYYIMPKVKLGTQGDYYTSSFIGSIMGEMLAACAVNSLIIEKSSWRIVEWGAGTGRLARHLMDSLQIDYPNCYAGLQYTGIDKSSYQRMQLLSQLESHLAKVQILEHEDWFGSAQEQGTIVIANELLDAFAVSRYCYHKHQWFELYVGWREQTQAFYEKLVPVDDNETLVTLQGYQVSWEEGQIIEINDEANQWISQISQVLPIGSYMILIDYGDQYNELFGSHRIKGTLLCYRQHQAHHDPYIHIGEQDITTHVNFSAIIHAAESAGLEVFSYGTQKQFLLSCGVLAKMQDTLLLDPFGPEAKKNRSIRQLLISDQMSELFKVLVLKKGKHMVGTKVLE